MPHIEWTITIGDMAMVLTVLFGLLGTIRKVEKILDFFKVEHELLINDYCHRHNIRPHELPTRSGITR